MKRLNCAIRSIEYYNSDTRRVFLEVPDDKEIEFKAGQYLEIILSDKKYPFSIASSPDLKDVFELHVRPTPNSEDSIDIENLLDSGATHIEVEVPKGDCFFEEQPDNPFILIAASTGVTQMKCIIEYLIPRDIKHPLYLYWGVLAETDLYLHDLFNGWVKAHSNFHYTPVISEPDTSPNWTGRTGLVGNAVLQDIDDLSGVTVLISGGPAMVYGTLDSFVERGMPEKNILSDIFSYAPR
ncbi:MAG: NAD(P)H-flavin reductase [Proteobacteria bacterium]|nr:NAD(P)H-flavin reductase [Pseudomonadota bacterium]